MLPNLCELSLDELRAENRRLRTYLQQIHRLSPTFFRNRIRLPESDAPIAERLTDWQQADFAALDRSWERVVGIEQGVRPFRLDREIGWSTNRAWIERPRGHSKTSDTALMVAWALVAADEPITGLAAAVDKDQARLLRRAIERLLKANLKRLGELKVTENGVKNRATGSELRVISSDAASSYGELVDFILCDELCHWTKPELWYSLLSTAAKREHCLLMVLTNAGLGTGWQWQAREQARMSTAWHFSTMNGPQAPWITANALEEQRRSLPEPVFKRLWLNEWQHSDGEFVTLAEAAACCDESLSIVDLGDPRHAYVAAIDYGEKHDYTAAVIAHKEGDRVVIDRLDVAVPNGARFVPVRWVEQWLDRQRGAFPTLEVWVDDHQLAGIVQKYERFLPVHRFNFRGGQGNHQLAGVLQQAILNRQIAWPTKCGAIETADGTRDDLETELASLVLQEKSRQLVRFNHTSRGHDDRAFVVAVACLKLIEKRGPEWMTVGGGW